MALASFKKNFQCVSSLEQFYSGGPYVVSYDGSFIACTYGEQIKIVDSSNASVKSTLEGDSEAVTALSISPDDNFLFSSSHSRLIRVWDLSTSKCLRSWKGHEGPVMRMACDASGGLLATGGSDRKVRVWDIEGGYCTHYFKGHKGVVMSIMFHPDPNRLLLFSGSDDATVRVWDLVSKKCVAVLEEHFSTITSLAVSENGWTLLSSGRDKVVILWDLRNYSSKMTVPTNEAIESVCVIENGTNMSACMRSSDSYKTKRNGDPPICFLTAGERGCVRIWNSESKRCIYEKQSSEVTLSSNEDDNGEKRGFISATLLPLGQGVLCVTADQQFLFYYPTQMAEGSFQLNLDKRLVGYNEEVADLKFLGEDEKFVAVVTNMEQVYVYELMSMSCAYVLAGHTDSVLCLDTCVSSAGRTLMVTGSKDNNVRLWEDKNRCCIGLGVGHMGAVSAVAFSRKKKNFFVSGSSDRTLKVWSLDGLEEGSDTEVSLKASAVVAAHDKDINTVAVAPNDNYVCSGSRDRTAHVWRLPDLVSVVVLRGHKRSIWSVEFSPVDQCVITSSGDKTIKIWAISDGSCLKTFEGHTSSVLQAHFLTRGTQFVSSGSDGLVKLWAVKTNECIATFDQHEAEVWALAVGKQTEMLATGSRDGAINLWHDCTAADKEEAFRKEEEGVLKGQELENAVTDADYRKAIQLAFELRRPHRLFDLFTELCRKGQAEDQIESALRALGNEEMRLLFEYVREWNTKPKLCHVAQFVLFRVFNILSPAKVTEIKGASELLEGLIPYTQRHFNRIDRLIRSTYLLDYTLTAMSVIDPENDDYTSKDEPELHSGKKEQVNKVQLPEENSIIEELEEKVTSKKRKAGKSKGTKKKLKGAAFSEPSTILLKA